MSPLPISALLPTLNAAASLPATLMALRGEVTEIIIADGGSTDGTPDIARACGAQVITAPRGRGPQLRAAADQTLQRLRVFRVVTRQHVHIGFSAG